MDKKKIFKLICLFFFFSCKSFAGVITYNFVEKTAKYQDLNGNIFNIGKESLQSVKQFDYFLLKELETNGINIIARDQKKEIIYNSNNKKIDPNQTSLFFIKNNFKDINNLLKKKNKTFESLIINTNKFKETILDNEIQKINYKYYFDRIRKKDGTSYWHYLNEDNFLILKKYGNKQVNSNDLYIFFSSKDYGSLPSKVNFRYTLATNNNKKIEGILEVYFTTQDVFIIEDGFILLKKIKFLKKKSLIDSFQNITIDETIVFFNSAFKLNNLSFDFFEIKNNINYSIQINNNYLLIPSSLENNGEEDNDYNINNINEKIVLYKYFSLPPPSVEILNKKKWTGNFDLAEYITFLSNNKKNKFLYVYDFKNYEIVNNVKSIVSPSLTLKYGLLTILYLVLIIYLLNRTFELQENIFNFVYKFGFLIITLLFLINFTGLIIKLHLKYNLISSFVIFELILGYLLLIIFMMICIIKKRQH